MKADRLLERQVLATLMLNRQAWDRSGHTLRPDDFADSDHREIFEGIRALAQMGIPLDPVMVVKHLDQARMLDDGGDYVTGMLGEAVSLGEFPGRVSALHDTAQCRAIDQIGLQIRGMTGTGDERLAQLQTMVTSVEEQTSPVLRPLRDTLADWLGTMQARSEHGDSIIGERTGWVDVDKRLGGMRPGDLIVLAGRPAMGKTMGAIEIALEVSKAQTVGLFSLEMTTEQLIDRIQANLAQVPLATIRSGQPDWPKVTKATAISRDLDLRIDDTPALSVEQIHARARQVRRRHGLGLVIIDYLQLVRTERRIDSREQYVSHISQSCKAMAKDLKVPVVLISQLNRALEKRQDKRPVMSDLRESGAIEQDADAIGFLYRDEVYNQASQAKGVCELIWAKVRNGRPGTDYLKFDGDCQRLKQLDKSASPVFYAGKHTPFSNPYKRSTDEPQA